MKFVHVFAISLLVISVVSDEHTHLVIHGQGGGGLWMNTVGPYHNRQETYAYFSLPFCSGPKDRISHYHESLSEALQGIDLVFSGYEMDFKEDVPRKTLCMVELTKDKVETFSYAVSKEYWYQMYIDGLPIWGKVGEKNPSDNTLSIYTHKKFEIGYNGKQIVDINLNTEEKKVLAVGEKIEFSYEVTWKPSAVKFENRFDKYLDPNFFQHRIIKRWRHLAVLSGNEIH
uniref:Transmembrane 9 superfamily member n=1 Tax=Megaselia scalaris TaxID=36166 RepID=T1GC29_MEGSC